MKWTDEVIILLLKECINIRPFDAERGMTDARWGQVASNLKSHYPALFPARFDSRAASMHLSRFLKDHKHFNAQSLRESGKQLKYWMNVHESLSLLSLDFPRH